MREKPDIFSRCLELCNRGLMTLKSVVGDLDSRIKKRKRAGAVKVVLEKGKIEMLRERLRSAQFMLMLSHQTYLSLKQDQQRDAHRDFARINKEEFQKLQVAVARKQVILIHSKLNKDCEVSQSTETGTESSESDPSLEVSMITEAKRPKGPKSRAWELGAYRAPVGWNLCLRSYNVVACDATIFKLAKEGDIAGMRSLFAVQEASPFDRNPQGWSLINTAALYGQLEACRMLLSYDADFNDSVLMVLVNAAALGMIDYIDEQTQTREELICLFCKELLFEDPFESEEAHHALQEFLAWLLRSCFESQHATGLSYFRWFLKHSESSYRSRSAEECVRFALNLSGTYQFGIYGILITLLDGTSLDVDACRVQNAFDRSLLHAAAEELAMDAALKQVINNTTSPSGELLAWITDLAKKGSSIHHQDCFWRTPLAHMVNTYFDNTSHSGALHHMRRARQEFCAGTSSNTFGLLLQKWLEALSVAGVDLIIYGKEEACLFERNVLKVRKPSETFFGYSWSALPSWRISHLDYGPNPEDWHLWCAPEMTKAFSQFWNMVEHPEKAMPGVWDESFDSDVDPYDDFGWGTDYEYESDDDHESESETEEDYMDENDYEIGQESTNGETLEEVFIDQDFMDEEYTGND